VLPPEELFLRSFELITGFGFLTFFMGFADTLNLVIDGFTGFTVSEGASLLLSLNDIDVRGAHADLEKVVGFSAARLLLHNRRCLPMTLSILDTNGSVCALFSVNVKFLSSNILW